MSNGYKKQKGFTYYMACDFETTTVEPTYCWSCASAMLFDNTDNVEIVGSASEWFKMFEDKHLLKGDKLVCWFHNLKFDGNFIISYLLRNGYTNVTENEGNKLQPMEYNECISEMGMWYTVNWVTEKGVQVEVRDSLKLFPMALKAVGKGFKTKHQKTEMIFEGKTCLEECTVDDITYIKNDVLVLKEALEIFLRKGYDKLTIGSNCMAEFRQMKDHVWEQYFPDLTKDYLDKDVFGDTDADYYIRRAYRGGYCYSHKTGTYVYGCTYDVNSLYPSVMHSKSGNIYPISHPIFWKGNFIPNIGKDAVYFVRVRCKFKLKPKHLPTIQIKGLPQYDSTEYLHSSDVKIGDKYYDHYYDEDGVLQPATPILTFTSVDFELHLKHYDMEYEILDGCWFYAIAGIFDEYIDKHFADKQNSKGAERLVAKLFLNNLYGKLSTSRDSSFRVSYLDNDIVKFKTVHQSDKQTIHIGMGAFVTAYARKFTITVCQMNYDYFCYADTDSGHFNTQDGLVGIKEHESDLLSWKRESDWDEALFVRQKTYCEHITHENREPVKPHWDIKAAGCPERCKKLFLERVDRVKRVEDKSEEEKEWVSQSKLKIRDFKVGLSIPGKLRAKTVEGGVILTPSYFTIKEG